MVKATGCSRQKDLLQCLRDLDFDTFLYVSINPILKRQVLDKRLILSFELNIVVEFL
ncbi:uncharacterized protein MELLADRAFT_55687 [Melampsora larici-populina 98AG31]|uniref:Uncharacterized protein n=1 Tax=Melampsora larici-populina (strain 98AG31 / pathotype 3-4-7) TaxID=747676 RepID=F4RH28_MELLP|nr:uncharacterized protein MELLADRAFT_55687 [Melampsora larici-populina 98AG31]EGG08303.1 hypothetical protein MELLADRAFT_55687 [Melampsora larici-populina 98AG31]